MVQLNGMDSLMVLTETSKAPLHIGALFIYAPPDGSSDGLAFNDVVAQMSLAIDTSLPMLKSRLEKLALNIDSPYWVIDKDFNIHFHLERVALPKPANWDELYALVGQFHAQPLNMERPLWQGQFVEGLDHLQGVPKGSVALILKIHHALADGKTAVKIFAALHSLSAEKNAPLIFEERDANQTNYNPPGFLKAYSRAYWHAITSPLKFMTNASKIVPKVLSSQLITRASYSGIPKTDFNATPSAQRLVRHIKIPMADIQQLEKRSGSTINDIALCVISGAMREYLQRYQALPDESLHAVIPVDVNADKALSNVGNHLSFINLKIASDMADAHERLRFIHKAVLEAKKETGRIGSQSFMSLANNTYSGFLGWLARQLINSKYIDKIPLISNTIITNVPGVPLPCYLCGAKLVDYVGLGPLIPTLSLFHVISSIESHVNISFQTCDEHVVNTIEYAEALQSSYRQLLTAYDMGGSGK
jgi:WS/DGAT/MGAT family acyltransferase